jgi:hypothetical protein
MFENQFVFCCCADLRFLWSTNVNSSEQKVYLSNDFLLGVMSEKTNGRVNKEFHSTFATIIVTVLSIMLAFYGITVITLTQQAQTINQNGQSSKGNAVGYMRQTDNAIRTFAYITEPPVSSSFNWSVAMEQDSNIRDMCTPYLKTDMSFSAMSNSAVNSLLGNYSEATREDEAIREWLNFLNITRFKASYNLAEFSLHDIVNMLYTQFPSPPAYRNESQTIVFIDSNFSNAASFSNWFQNYTIFYNDVSAVHSRINESIAGISQAYSDAAKLTSEELDQLQKENITDTWTIQSLGEIMTYDKAMSTYYPSVFESLDTTFSSGTNAEANINQYNLYIEQYTVIYNLVAFPYVLWSVVLMALGFVIPMFLLGRANWIESRLDIRKPDVKKWQRVYNLMIVLSIVFFAVGAILGWYLLGMQISKLIPPP